MANRNMRRSVNNFRILQNCNGTITGRVQSLQCIITNKFLPDADGNRRPNTLLVSEHALSDDSGRDIMIGFYDEGSSNCK